MWILIVTLSTAYGAGIASAEYLTEQRCIEAGQSIKLQHDFDDKMAQKVKFSCSQR